MVSVEIRIAGLRFERPTPTYRGLSYPIKNNWAT